MANAITATFGLDSKPFESGLMKVRRLGLDAKKALTFEGLEGEKRVERNLGSLAGELANAKNGFEALGSVADRLENTFKGGLAIGIGVSAGIALKGALDRAAQSANKLFDSYQKATSTPLTGKSVDDLNKVKDSLQEIAEEAEKKPQDGSLLENWIFGKTYRAQAEAARADIENITKLIEKSKAAADVAGSKLIEEQTRINELKISESKGDQQRAQFYEIELKYRKMISEELAKGNVHQAESLRLQMTQELIGVRLVNQRAEIAEQEKKAKEQTEATIKRNQAAQEERVKIQEKQKELEEKIVKASYDRLGNEKKLAALLEQKRKLEQDSIARSGEAAIDAKSKLLDVETEIDKVNDSIKKKNEEIADLMKKQADEAQNLLKASEALKTFDKDRSARTLGEIAGGAGTPSQRARARRIQKLEERARRQQDLGQDEKATETRGKADELRKGLRNLNSSERDPLATYKEALKVSEKLLGEINTALAGKFVNQ